MSKRYSFSHLVFYDGECGLCDWAVQWILKWDKRKQFGFTPLQGEYAKEALKELYAKEPELDSLVLIENFQEKGAQPLIRGGAVLRICWQLGGIWALLGCLSFLPSWPFDRIYDVVARNRHRFFRKDPFCDIPDSDSRSRFI